jgi:teichuronic acid biosynthesis glycosyltransferase TuaH
VGHIQPRLRIDLMVAAAEAADEAGTVLRVIGGIQGEPDGWDDLLHHPAVRFDGPRFGDGLDTALANAAVGLVPHAVDAYTRSQDAMKAWDYLARGLSVVSSSVPPVSRDMTLGRLADHPDAFRVAVASALKDDRELVRRDSQEQAAANGWDRRARRLAELVDSVR